MEEIAVGPRNEEEEARVECGARAFSAGLLKVRHQTACKVSAAPPRARRRAARICYRLACVGLRGPISVCEGSKLRVGARCAVLT
eukprot:116892-Rhodomonas_salina.1